MRKFLVSVAAVLALSAHAADVQTITARVVGVVYFHLFACLVPRL